MAELGAITAVANTDGVLPDGWAQAQMNFVGAWHTGGTPSRKTREYFGGGIPWVKSGDLSDGSIQKTEETISAAGLANSAAKVLPRGALCVALYGATIGKLGILEMSAATNQACASCVVDPSAASTKYLFYYLLQQRQALIQAGQGGAQPNLTNQIVREWPLPLPPLREQQRIVAQLDAVLDHIRSARDHLSRVPLILKRFRQAVLAAACSGRLTEDWRLRNAHVEPAAQGLKRILGIREQQLKARHDGHKMRKGRNAEQPSHDLGTLSEIPDTWVSASVGQVFVLESGEAFKAIDYAEDGLRLFQIANVGFGRTLWEQRNFLPVHFAKDYSELILHEGDICIALNRPILGSDLKVTRIGTDDLPAILYQRVGLLRAVEALSGHFGFFYFQSPLFRELVRDNLQGTDQLYLNFSLLPRFVFPFPPVAEMDEIVGRVKSLFALADAIEKRVVLGALCADKLTQSMLAKAFRGELVPTEAELARREGREYEPASVLLERIKAERTSKPKPAKRSRKSVMAAASK